MNGCMELLSKNECMGGAALPSRMNGWSCFPLSNNEWELLECVGLLRHNEWVGLLCACPNEWVGLLCHNEWVELHAFQ